MTRITVYEFCKKNNLEHILEEWNYEKNNGATPENTGTGAKHKVFWKCKHGHEWESSILHRLYGRRSGCPYCKNRRILKNFNELSFLKPELLEEWDYDKNKDMNPEDIFAGSATKVWWKCNLGHEWKARVQTRASDGTGCPYCTNRKVMVGFNDLATTHPDIAEEWHPSKNNITPQDIVKGSDKKVWWKCKYGHEWETKVNKRTRENKPTRCPECRRLGL